MDHRSAFAGGPRVRVRPRTRTDDVVPLLLRVHAADGYPLHATPEIAVAFVAAAGDTAWVAEDDDGVLVGHVALHRDRDGSTLRHAAALTGLSELVLLSRLFVDPAAQRSGVGRVLLRHALEQARSRGLRAVLDVGQVFTKAVALYEDEGWTCLGPLQEVHDGVALDLWVYLSPDLRESPLTAAQARTRT